jgi:hypothetical protein
MENEVAMNEFEKELENLINKHSVENKSNTPDFMLAEYLRGCLDLFANIIQQREQWYGRPTYPGAGICSGPDPVDLTNVLSEDGITKAFQKIREGADCEGVVISRHGSDNYSIPIITPREPESENIKPKTASLSPREVSILVLLAQKAEEDPVNIEELGLSETAKKLAATLISKKTANSIPEIVWQNECCLVFRQDHGNIGEMGLCYTDEETGVFNEVQVSIRETGTGNLMKKLRGQSVRITIETVPEGNK